MAFTGSFGNKFAGCETAFQFLPIQAMSSSTTAGQVSLRASHTSASSTCCNDGTNLAQLESSIFRHPELQNHFKTVRTYLILDSWVLEPISYLRQEGFLSTSIAMDPSVRLPQRRQIADLASVQPLLFGSPPTELFNLICQYRQRSGFRETGILQRLDKLKESWLQPKSKPEVGGKTAPEGQVYKCPSVNCKKSFRKAGHATNHMESYHPEYLQLHPDYQPQQFTIQAPRSASTSPELDRRSVSDNQSESTSSSRHSLTISRPMSGHYDSASGRSGAATEYFTLTPPSPAIFDGPSSFDSGTRDAVYQPGQGMLVTRPVNDRRASHGSQNKLSRNVFASTEYVAETHLRHQNSRHSDTNPYMRSSLNP